MTAKIVLAAFAALCLSSTGALAETVLARVKVGNNIEGMTYAPNGRYAHRALAIDGNDVVAIRIPRLPGEDEGEEASDGEAAEQDARSDQGDGQSGHGKGGKHRAFSKVFDVLALPLAARTPRGIVYSPVTRQFYFSSKQATSAQEIFSTDERGNPRPSLHPAVANPETWNNWEGMTWIPADAPAHPNTIAALGARTDFLSHVYFIRLDGTVEAEVVPEPAFDPANPGPLNTYLCGIDYNAGSLLATACGSDVYGMGLDGKLTANPAFTFPETDDVESVITDASGYVFAAGYEGATLRAFDPSFVRAPGRDQAFRTGLGVSAGALAWDGERNEILTLSRFRRTLYAISGDLQKARKVLETSAYAELNSPEGLSALGGGMVAIANRFYPRGLAVIDTATGAVSSRPVFDGASYPGGRPFRVTGAAGFAADTFLISVVGDPDNLRVVTRRGAPSNFFPTAIIPIRLPDLALSERKGGPYLQVFDAGHGTRINTGAKIFDGQGKLVHAFDDAALAFTDARGAVAWIGDNRYVALDGDTSTLVFFTIP